MSELIKLSDIEVNYFKGPMCSYGFRTGMWKYKYKGIEGMIYLSLPQQMDFDEQEEALKRAVQKKLIKEDKSHEV
jgi:hypothetical protein